jgi:hypothetical protein
MGRDTGQRGGHNQEMEAFVIDFGGDDVADKELRGGGIPRPSVA